jgi:hypothetical protein
MIVPQREVAQKEPSTRWTPLERRCYAWLHEHTWCCLTGLVPIEIAHLGAHSGTGLKSPLNTLLPLTKKLHHAEHQGRDLFWHNVRIPDYLEWADELHKIFLADDDPSRLLLEMYELADQDYLRTLK